MKVSPGGVTLIKRFEGFPYGGRPYRDAVGVWTIGYGHTKGVGPHSRRISETQASALLLKDLNDIYAPPVARLMDAVHFNPTQNEFDAIVSAVYNLGPGVLDRGRSLGDAIRTKSRRAVASALLLYDKAGGRRLLGLTRRRQAERALFLEESDPLEHYTASEKRWIREYDRLVREDRDKDRRRVLRRVMTEQRQRIWKSARPKSKGGDGKGWDHANRRERYASLLARTK